jgi:MraZ protein
MFTGFTGKFLHTLDEKGRITFPVSYRESLGESPFILSGFDNNIQVMTNARFIALYDLINSMNMGDEDSRELRRIIFSTASEIEFDKTGRLLIPPYLRESAFLDGSVLVMGVGNAIEIWNPKTYEEKKKSGNYPKSAADLVSKFNIPF